MSLTFKQIEAFYWAAKLGTFAIAAERLHVTQSSLSKRIVELEVVLGYPVFDRSGKRARLTEAGARLLDRARQVIELTRSLVDDAQADALPSGVCRFGISEQSATTWFPAFVDRMRADFPRVVPKPQVGLGRSLERLVERGELDFAVIAGAPSLDGIAGQTVAQVEFAWMAAPQRLRAGTWLRPETFAEHAVIISTSDSGLTSAFEQWMAAAQVRIAQSISCNSLTAIVGLAVAGQGISFLPTHYVAPLVARKRLVRLRAQPAFPKVPYSFIWRADDGRKVIAALRALAMREVDFRTPNLLWAL